MSSATGSETRSGIGARLKAGRERLGMTLLQVAEKLHVDGKVVEAVEADRFAELSAPVYVRGHIKRYAELVGESTTELLDAYAAATKPAPPDLTQLPKASQQAHPGKLVVPSLVILIGFALVGMVWWALQNLGSARVIGSHAEPQAISVEPEGGEPAAATEESTRIPEAVSSLPPPAAGGATSAISGSAKPDTSQAPKGSSSLAPKTAGTPAARAGSTTEQAATASAATSVAGRPQATQPGHGSAVVTPANQTTAQPTNAVNRSGDIDVTLKFAGDSWVEVYDAKGKRLFYEIGPANSSRTLSGAPPLRVVLGSPKAVSLDVNGKPATVPTNAVQEDGAHFTVNRSGRIVRSRAGAGATPGKQGGG